MKGQVSERLQLREKALLLQARVEEYYRSKGFDLHPRGLANFLKRIAELLLVEEISPRVLRESDFGIFRILTDNPELERSELGEALLDFGLELRKLADMLEGKR